MAVIIDCIDLPKDCGVCPLSYYDDEYMNLWCPYFNSDVSKFQRKRKKHCPMVKATTKDGYVYQALHGEEADNDKTN